MTRRGLSRREVAAVLAVMVGAAGCGYSLRPSLPPHIKTVHIPVLQNRTQEPGVEDFVTRALTDAFVTSGRVRIASNASAADAVLEGSVTGYTLTALSFDRSANVTRYRLQIALSLTLSDRQKNSVIWKHDRLEEQADFDVSGQVTQNLVREEAAVQKAAADIGRAIVSLALEGF